jgi:3-hydroxyacyl-[acyl-carrier-protein] dehydratase
LNRLDIYNVLKHLPHRYPMLLIDRVLDYTEDKSLVAIKNVSINEPFFQGHFPNRPVMPGVLVVEAMAQACGLLSFRTLDVQPGKTSVYLFVGIDKARFKRLVEPGDQLRIEVNITRKMHNIWKFSATAKVDDELCCSADLMCTYKEFD